ncbi:Tumor protein D52 [Fukomys damarensis]|uniref:Tumor protein D52 n=1 Tax=Fukomys damarensis TaxID=885580 RepID=A0A091DA82_FUKDA|nr:Tumor protein D52 [Fukomys damarensis]
MQLVWLPGVWRICGMWEFISTWITYSETWFAEDRPSTRARRRSCSHTQRHRTLSEEGQDEPRRQLAKVEEEIQTLSQVLAAKEKHLAEIKWKLGIGSLQELKQNIAKGWRDVTATST